MKALLCAIFLLVLNPAAKAAAQKPAFRNFPAKVTCAKPAPIRFENSFAKKYSSRIRAGVHNCPNFAGHYTVVSWGCGTECGVYAIVDNSTGDVYAPPEISRGVSLGVGEPEFRPDSTLMSMANCLDPKIYGLKSCERKFYRWDGSHLILIGSFTQTLLGSKEHP